MTYIQIKQLVKKFNDKEVLKPMDLTIEQGSLTTLLGPSGCGKSTLLRSIAGLHSIDGGEIIIEDKRIDKLSPKDRSIGMVFQNYALFPNMNVNENIRFGLEMKKMNRAEADRKVAEMVELVGLKGREQAYPRQLSGGQQQRVALARALVNEPKVLLLDEPLSALDAQIRKHLQAFLKRIQKELGITMILVTHDQEEAMALSDYVYILNDGYIAQEGAPTDIYKHPKNEFIAKFIGNYNVLNKESIQNIFGQNVVAETVAIRPETIGTVASEGSLELNGRILDTAMLGSIMRYTVDVNGTPLLVDRLNRSYQRIDDDQIKLFISPEDIIKIN